MSQAQFPPSPRETGGTSHPGVEKVRAALREAGLDGCANGIRMLDDDARTAEHAAKALGTTVGAIANSLVFAADIDGERRPLLALTSGAHRADTAKLAEAIGARAVHKADAAFVRTHTGQAIGGVAPIGHPSGIRTVVDSALAQYPTVWAAAGHPKSIYPTSFTELLRLTAGTEAEIGERT